MFLMQTFLNFQKDGWQVALSPAVCRILEEFLLHANNPCLEILFKTFSNHWQSVINSKFCYHVLHKALIKCQNEKLSDDSILLDYVLEFCNHMKKHLDEYIKHPHAAHTARLYLQIVGGVQIPKDKNTGTFDLANIRRCTPLDSDYMETITNIFKKILTEDRLKNYVCDTLVCPFVQILIIIVSIHLPELFEENIETIQRESGLFSRIDTETIPLFNKRLRMGYVHPTAIYFTETFIGVMPGKLFQDFYQKRVLHFPKSKNPEKIPISTASIMSSHPIASRVLRAVIRRIHKFSDLSSLLDSLEQAVEYKGVTLGLAGALKNGQHAVLNDLAIACSKSQSDDLQRRFLNLLPPLFGVSVKKPTAALGEDQFIQCLVSLRHVKDLTKGNSEAFKSIDDGGHQTVDNSTGPVTLPGCLFTKTLLKFKCPPTRVVASLCSQTPKRLLSWAYHPILSRVLEEVILSPSVPPERKTFIYSVLKPELPELACDKSGSHVVEALWESIKFMKDPHTTRESFASELSKVSNRLKSHTYGHFSYFKCGLQQFETNRDAWLRRWSAGPKSIQNASCKRQMKNNDGNTTGIKRMKITPKKPAVHEHEND